MGNFVIHIEGVGCHHNSNPEIDVDLLAPKLVDMVRKQGHTITHAVINTGGQQSIMQGSGSADAIPTAASADKAFE